MKKSDSLRPRPTPTRGVLYRAASAPAPGYGRFTPPAQIEPFVEHLWTVSWRDVSVPETHETLPHPSVHLTLEPEGAFVVGVPRGRFTRTLHGSGRVLAVKFRPGGFRPFFGRSVAELTGTTLPARRLFGSEIETLACESSRESDAAALRLLADFLVLRCPPPDERADLASRIVEHAAADRTSISVRTLAETFGLSPRSLQRLFHEYIGVSPKWVLQRFRLHEAAQRIESGDLANGSDLALELGYSDQAHFIRDFRNVVGRPPRDYDRRRRG